MTFIAQDEINHIRSNASIVDIISSYIPLTQKGKNYFGVCPFHEDHSPSMSVSDEKQIYKCFSCGASGNVFTFVENYLNVNFAEAVEIIAGKVGISVSIGAIKKKESKYQEEYDILNFALKFYQNNLNAEIGQKALAYLKTRGLFEETIKDFSIGLSLDKNSLFSLLTKKGYDAKKLLDIGLINKNDEAYDVFQNRIMFPIHNLDGQVVGFTARCYLSDSIPKYLNTKETYLFKKGQILFNYHRAQETIRLNKEVIVVEGNMDAIRLFSVGIKNVIALMGTSLTKDQTDALKKLRAKIILMLDNDNAGEKATFTIGTILEEANIPFSIVRLSGEKDPDEYIIKKGKEALLENLKNAISFVDFKLNYLKKNKNLNDASDLAEYIKAVLDGLKTSNDSILKEVTLQKLASEYMISYDVLKEQLGVSEKQQEKTIKKNEKSKPVLTNYEKVCSKILYYMMHSKEFIKLYQTKLGVFPTKEHRLIANEIVYYLEQHKTISLADFISYAENTKLKEEIMAIIRNEKEINLTEEGMLELLQILEKKIKKEEIKKLKAEIKNEYDINKKLALIEKIAEIKKEV